MLKWKRGRSQLSTVARSMVWESHCKRYRVRWSHIILADQPVAENGRVVYRPYADRFYAQRDRAGVWEILSTHRSRAAAAAACERHAKKPAESLATK